jgi:hypothetical protein
MLFGQYVPAFLEWRHRGSARRRYERIPGRRTVVIGGIELAEKIKKGQFKIGKLGGTVARMPEIWQAALAA